MQQEWLSELKYSPLSNLLSSSNEAIEYFTKRDLLNKTTESLSFVWNLPGVQKVFGKQQRDGSWSYNGKKTVTYPQHHYPLIQTWKIFRPLVEQYQITKEHPDAMRASEFLFSCQTEDGDIRGMLANQYATYYTGAIMALLVKAGYENDARVERGLEWLLFMRQDDGGWTIPLLTHTFTRKEWQDLTSKYAEPVEPDRSKPFSHNWTDMVLRAFAVHPKYRRCKEALRAADLLKASFFQPDAYSSYHDESYWVRFLFWWPNLVTALDTLSLMDYSKDDLDVKKGLAWLRENQLPNGLWKPDYTKNAKEKYANEKFSERSLWLTLSIAKIFKRFYNET